MRTINSWTTEIHKLAKKKGWWKEKRSALEIHALIHSEVAEATEDCRSGKPPVTHEYDGRSVDVKFQTV